MKNMIRTLCTVLCVVLLIALLPGCEKEPEGAAINGKSLAEYAIVYSDTDTDYAKRAAQYLQTQIREITGVELPIQEDSEVTASYEIVVGNTEREISSKLDADTQRDEFAIMSHGKQVALEGDYFLIAAAAYYFVQTYITGPEFHAKIPREVTVCHPIVEAPDNYILMIGDGMGPNHTKLFEKPPVNISQSNKGYSDGEDVFYGYLLPNHGFARTDSLSGTTDSAASGTALATGYKTINYYVGQDKDHNPVKSLTELANELGKSTAVMSTEVRTGATPSAFSAHADNRNDSADILESQKAVEDAGTIIRCDYDVYTNEEVPAQVEGAMLETLAKLEENDKGFFMMYEEAYIDKHSHINDVNFAFLAVLRFNQVIGTVMEYAFYHPNTFVLITADHETGMLKPGPGGMMAFNSDSHTGTDVPVFAFGQGSELFNDQTVENVQIPKTIAKFWGVADFGDPSVFPALG